MEIIRNCSHYSSIHTAVCLDEQALPSTVMKTAFTANGAMSIKREAEGIRWYENKRGITSSAIISFDSHGDSFTRLNLLYKHGQQGDLRIPLAKNYKRIYNALTHYIDVFRRASSAISHGDYSIDNVLFEGDDVVWIMDWEDFNDKLPREFDIVYCVTEACYFSYKKNKGLSVNEVGKAADLLKYVMERLGMPFEQIVKAPASYMRKLFLDNSSVFGQQIMKYPLVNCPADDIFKLDSLFSKAVT